MIESMSQNSEVGRGPWNEVGRTPIHEAACHGHTEIANALIGCITNPNAPDSHGCTPTHFAAELGHTEIVNALIRYADNPNAPNNDGRTPIHQAALKGHTEIVKAQIVNNAPGVGGMGGERSEPTDQKLY